MKRPGYRALEITMPPLSLPSRMIEEDEDYFSVTIRINGTPHHLQGIRVDQTEEGLVPTKDPHDRYADVCQLYDYPMRTTKVEGLPGEWLLYMHPHG